MVPVQRFIYVLSVNKTHRFQTAISSFYPSQKQYKFHLMEFQQREWQNAFKKIN